MRRFNVSVPNIIAASVAISFLGFFSGPFFATVSVEFNGRILSSELRTKIVLGYFRWVETFPTKYSTNGALLHIRYWSNWWLIVPCRHRRGCIQCRRWRVTAYPRFSTCWDGAQLALGTKTKGVYQY